MSDEPLILALDQGTSSSRAILFDRAGAAHGLAQQPIASTYPRPGWVEQDAAEILDATVAVGRGALADAGVAPDRIAAVAIANQRETTILWERRTGRPVAPAIVWQSRQSQPLVDAIAARGMAPDYERATGLVPDAYFSATKIAWLLERQPDLRPLAERGDVLFGTVETWLLWNFTGGAVHATDAANASRTMLLDLRSGDWSQPLLDDLRIPRAMLPRVVANSGALAEVDARFFGRALPLAGMAGDQQAALFGQGCFAPGQAKNTYGTGSFLLLNTGETPVPCRNRILSTVAWRLSSGSTTFAREGAIFSTGSAVQWLRDGLGIIPDAAAVEPLAASVPDSGGVFLVPAFTGLGAPWWDPAARGAVLGITPAATAAHLARATLEAIAFQTRDVVDAMAADGGVRPHELRVDGGAARNDLLLQIQADLLGVPVLRPANVETTALGAAYLAGLAVGLYDGLPEIARRWRPDRVFEPRISADERDARHADWRRAVERALGWDQSGVPDRA